MTRMIREIMISPLGVCIVLVAAYYLLRGVAAYNQGYKWDEMDWDGDGETAVSEFLASGDIGKRKYSEAGRRCVEYFHYIDTAPVRLKCA